MQRMVVVATAVGHHPMVMLHTDAWLCDSKQHVWQGTPSPRWLAIAGMCVHCGQNFHVDPFRGKRPSQVIGADSPASEARLRCQSSLSAAAEQIALERHDGGSLWHGHSHASRRAVY
jgi:hypothetical protein